jgi:hypothetical protein
MHNRTTMNRKYTTVIMGVLFIHLAAVAQSIETVIKIQAMDMAKAVLAKDIDKLANYLPPKLIEEAGGKEKMLVARDTMNKYMKQFGAEIKRVTIGNPGKIITYKNQLQATVPQTTELKFMASTITLETTLIAISEDKGQHWYFVDTSIYREDKLKLSLPNLSPELVIPPMKKPKIVPNE